jgi:hypothetical protein
MAEQFQRRGLHIRVEVQVHTGSYMGRYGADIDNDEYILLWLCGSAIGGILFTPASMASVICCFGKVQNMLGTGVWEVNWVPID